MKELAWLQVHLDDAGYIKEHSKYSYTVACGFGFDVTKSERPRFARDMARRAVIMDNGFLYLSNEIASRLVETRFYDGACVKYGKRKMWKADAQFIREAQSNNAYPRRNKREQEVQQRNTAFVAWLIKVSGS